MCSVSPGQRNDRAKTDVQMCMFQEAFGRVGEPVEEDVYCLVDLIIELTRGRNVEETVE